MGMDVYGKKPTAPEGDYFRNTIWFWHPLWTYCERVAPRLIPDNNAGHFNSGWGLNASRAKALAEVLENEIAAGHTARYKVEYDARNDSKPDEPCTVCAGTGNRLEPPSVGAGDKPCNGCEATGHIRPWDTHYPFTVENVSKFAAFLAACGGFRIL